MYSASWQPSVFVSRRLEFHSGSHLLESEVSSRCSFQFLAPSRASFSLKHEGMMPLLNRVRNPQRWDYECRAQPDSRGVQTDLDDSRKEVFNMAAQRILDEDDIEGGTGFDFNAPNGGSASGNGERGYSKVMEKNKKKSKEQEIDWEKVATMPDDLDLSQRHPLDPHKPNYSELLPEPLRPYPSFEGWFVRVTDPENKFSAAVILATNYATDESQVTLLFAPGKNADKEGDREAVKYGYTYAVRIKTKDAKFTKKEQDEEWENRGEKPEGFEWEANGIGRISVTPHVTDVECTVEGYTFKAHLTKELLWDAHKSEKGPEGWARYVSIIPTHWYVYSLGSTVEYTFSNPEKNIYSEGSAFGHVEKNWGQTFPAGHVWMQGFSSDNTAQICCSGAYFKTPNEKLSSPYVFVLGYRSPKLQLDFRTNDLGIVFKDFKFATLEGRASVTAVGPSHTVKIKAHAPFDTFSDPVLAPVTKTDWEPACRESFVATIEVEVYEHLAWGIPGTENLVETSKFEYAALEFGEDLLSDQSSESEGNQN